MLILREKLYKIGENYVYEIIQAAFGNLLASPMDREIQNHKFINNKNLPFIIYAKAMFFSPTLYSMIRSTKNLCLVSFFDATNFPLDDGGNSPMLNELGRVFIYLDEEYLKNKKVLLSEWFFITSMIRSIGDNNGGIDIVWSGATRCDTNELDKLDGVDKERLLDNVGVSFCLNVEDNNKAKKDIYVD